MKVFFGRNTLGGSNEKEKKKTANKIVLSDDRPKTLGVDSQSHTQVTERKFADIVREEMKKTVAAVESRIHGTNLTALSSLVLVGSEMAEGSITRS